jgi:molybdopterin synthase sulfur carrier subunit
MKVRVYATLRPIVGGPTVQVERTPGDSVRSVLDELIERWPELKSELFDGSGALHNNIHVFVNGRDVRYLGGLDIAIPDGADLRIFPPVGGGAAALAARQDDDEQETATEVEHSADYYGVPIFLMRDYLSRLGAVEGPDLTFSGDGWTAHLAQAPWKSLGSLRIGGATATVRGEEGVVEALLERLHLMTQRGGG